MPMSCVQEVESLEALTWFRDNYLADMGYDHIASEDVGYYRGVEQSLLSRFPIRDVKTWTNANLDRVKRVGGGWDEVPSDMKNIRFQRSPLRATIKTPEGYELTLFVMHHKSGQPLAQGGGGASGHGIRRGHAQEGSRSEHRDSR